MNIVIKGFISLVLALFSDWFIIFAVTSTLQDLCNKGYFTQYRATSLDAIAIGGPTCWSGNISLIGVPVAILVLFVFFVIFYYKLLPKKK